MLSKYLFFNFVFYRYLSHPRRTLRCMASGDACFARKISAPHRIATSNEPEMLHFILDNMKQLWITGMGMKCNILPFIFILYQTISLNNFKHHLNTKKFRRMPISPHSSELFLYRSLSSQKYTMSFFSSEFHIFPFDRLYYSQ